MVLLLALPGAPEGTVELPMTVGRVWYRTADKGIARRLFRAGDLTLGEDALELTDRRTTTVIPLERIRYIGYGKMKGDVETDWVVLTLEGGDVPEVVGFRDARRLGYGRRTPEIYDGLRGAFARLGAAQYDVPAGLRVFEGFQPDCTLAVPDGWQELSHTLVVAHAGPDRGTVLFSSELVRDRMEKEGRVLWIENAAGQERVRAGEVPALFVERRDAGRGMTCEGLSDAARAAVVEHVRAAWFEVEPESVEITPASVGGCAGQRIVGRIAREGGAEPLIVEVVAVARSRTLYLFAMRARAERHASFREPFLAALATVGFSAAD
jgi:hypothetical protein